MTTTHADQISARLDGPIHGWFGLTYSNYLVLHRSLMQSMPVEWQERAVALFDQLDAAFPDLERPTNFIVTPAAECTYSELDPGDLVRLRITCEAQPVGGYVYTDDDGVEHGDDDSLLVPLPADPVPHYNRGRTFIPSTEGATA